MNQQQNFDKVLSSGQRLLSLDVLRGLTIAGMILVNDPGSWEHIYAPLEHAAWNGFTPTDLVYPFFIFIVGVSIALVYTKRLDSGANKSDLYGKLVVRSLMIFGFGAFLSFYPNFFSFSSNPLIGLLERLVIIIAVYVALVIWKSNWKFKEQSNGVKWTLGIIVLIGGATFLYCYNGFALDQYRIVGVLQRIAVVYLVCSLIFLNTSWKTQAIISAVILIGYWIVMYTIPVPGAGGVFLEPGKNIAAWLDSQLIPGRMWQGTWDPEGFLSTFPSIVTGISGMLVGTLIVSKLNAYHKIIWLFVGGFIAFLIGGMWDWFFPINKNLWSSSFVMYTSGAAAMGLASCIWFVDILGYKKWTSFGVILGSNALAAYLLHGMISGLFHINFGSAESYASINSVYFSSLLALGLAPKLVSLIWAILYVLLCYLPMLWLYKKKIFIKV